MHSFMCIIDVFPCSPLSLCVVITWIVDVFPFIPIVVVYYIGKKRMCWFLTSSSSSSPSFSSEQAHKTLSTFYFFTMCDFLLEAPISFYVLSSPCFCHYCYMLCVVLCIPMCSPCSSSSFFATCGCHMNSQCVGIQVEQAHTPTQHFFWLQCVIFLSQ